MENKEDPIEVRKCCICSRPLSIYNKKDHCFCHDVEKDRDDCKFVNPWQHKTVNSQRLLFQHLF